MSYQPGRVDMLQFHQNAKGHRSGARIVVGDADQTRLLPGQAAKFQAYRAEAIALVEGDVPGWPTAGSWPGISGTSGTAAWRPPSARRTRQSGGCSSSSRRRSPSRPRTGSRSASRPVGRGRDSGSTPTTRASCARRSRGRRPSRWRPTWWHRGRESRIPAAPGTWPDCGAWSRSPDGRTTGIMSLDLSRFCGRRGVRFSRSLVLANISPSARSRSDRRPATGASPRHQTPDQNFSVPLTRWLNRFTVDSTRLGTIGRPGRRYPLYLIRLRLLSKFVSDSPRFGRTRFVPTPRQLLDYHRYSSPLTSVIHRKWASHPWPDRRSAIAAEKT